MQLFGMTEEGARDKVEADDRLWRPLKGADERKRRLGLSCRQRDTFESVVITSLKLDYMTLLSASPSLVNLWQQKLRASTMQSGEKCELSWFLFCCRLFEGLKLKQHLKKHLSDS